MADSDSTGGASSKLLIGTDDATIDDKGRLLFSKKKRDRLGSDFVVTLGTVGCLVAYPAASWEKVMEEVFSHEAINQGREQYARLVLGLADDDVRFDAQGRAVIPQKLRELAKLKDKVKLIGLGDRLEIWAAAEYAKYLKNPDGYGKERKEAIEAAYKKMKGTL